MSLESHLESRKGTEAWQICQDRVIDVMKKTLVGVMVFEVLYPQLDFKGERIQELVGIFETNSIEARLCQTEVHGLYEMGSMMEHSCVPNINMSFDEKFHLTSTAGRDIEKGEHLSIMYTHCFWGTWALRDHLIKYKKFWCFCKRCSDPSELDKNPSNILEGTVPEFRGFLEKYSKELYSSHYYMVAARHSILQMVGRVEGPYETKSLMEPRDLLIETASVLRDETNTKLPEGQLRKQVDETLIQLKVFMKTVGEF
ncbi:hypothetical protein TCAL_15406 [Tigriopus californicus]|uniref:SET domain-containing protein n=1 Tax=Tigriopus californicus TaxID=6832 RepID=A0A553PST7_TIGCA|nr:hypothetical protein TCAL_15406 [Tigriopus californicus]